MFIGSFLVSFGDYLRIKKPPVRVAAVIKQAAVPEVVYVSLYFIKQGPVVDEHVA